MASPSASAGQPCLCPQPDDPSDPVSVQQARDERKRLAALRPAKACKPLTRINVNISDLPGLTGVFRLNTGSENAAVETADSGDAMAIARAAACTSRPCCASRWRVTVGGRQAVPGAGPPHRQVHAGDRRRALPAGPSGLIAQLQGAAPEQRRAITSGAASSRRARNARPLRSSQQKPPTAQDIADAAAKAVHRGQIRDLKKLSDEHRLGQDMICPPGGDIYEELDSYLHAGPRNSGPAEVAS